MTTGKTIALMIRTFVSKVMSLSKFVIAFLSRSKRLNFIAAVTVCSDFGVQENKVCDYFHCFPIYLQCFILPLLSPHLSPSLHSQLCISSFPPYSSNYWNLASFQVTGNLHIIKSNGYIFVLTLPGHSTTLNNMDHFFPLGRMTLDFPLLRLILFYSLF